MSAKTQKPALSWRKTSFVVVALLIVMQVLWWQYVFFTSLDDPRKKNMFFVESSFFLVVTLVGLVLLYRALGKERKLLQIQRNFIQMVTHESKTPLTSLKLRLEGMLEDYPENQEFLKGCLQDCQRISQVLERALQLEKVEQQKLSKQPFFIAKVIEDLVRRLDYVFMDKKVKVEMDLASEVEVEADPVLFQSALRNLIENGIRYNEKHEKKISLKLYASTQKKAVLLVSDNGEGIEVDDKPSIFSPFYRGKNAYVSPGHGLGLYFAKTVFHAHGADLSLVESSSQGTTFRIELPLCKP